MIQIWRGEATLDAAQELLKLTKVFLAENAGQIGNSLSIVESRSPPPTDKVRPVLSACYRELAPSTRNQIFVAEGSGFRSALIRGVGLTVSTFAPSLLPFKFAASVDEAALAIAPSLPPRSGGTEALKQTIIRLRTKLDEFGPR